MESKAIEPREEDAVRLLPERRPLLPALLLRLQDLPGMYERKSLGDDVQQYHLGVSRLRKNTFLLDKTRSRFRIQGSPFPVYAGDKPLNAKAPRHRDAINRRSAWPIKRRQ